MITPGQSSALTIPTSIGVTPPATYTPTIQATSPGAATQSQATSFRVARANGAFNPAGGLTSASSSCGSYTATSGGNSQTPTVTFSDGHGHTFFSPVGAGYFFSPNCRATVVLQPVTNIPVIFELAFTANGGYFGRSFHIDAATTNYYFSPDDSVMLTVEPAGSGSNQAQVANAFDLLTQGATLGSNAFFTGPVVSVQLNALSGPRDEVRLTFSAPVANPIVWQVQ